MRVVTLKNKYLSQDDLKYLLNYTYNNMNDLSICSFASYGINDFDNNTVDYIKELSKFFTHVIIMTNIDRGYTKKAIEFPLNVSLCYTENKNYDFGMHNRLILTLYDSDLYHNKKISRIGLINDSCFILSSLYTFFKWGENKEIWGLTKSFEGYEHLQSYFLIFESEKSIFFLFEYFKNHDIFQLKNKQDVIQVYEIGLSKYFLEHNFCLSALYTSEMLTQDNKNKYKNPSFIFWKEMLKNGSPLLKKKVRRL